MWPQLEYAAHTRDAIACYAERTVLALARQAVHEGVHHLFDIRVQATSRRHTT